MTLGDVSEEFRHVRQFSFKFQVSTQVENAFERIEQDNKHGRFNNQRCSRSQQSYDVLQNILWVFESIVWSLISRYCAKSKRLLDAHSIKYGLMELDERGNLSFGKTNWTDDGGAIQSELAKMTGGNTVPRIFIDSQFVGGCDGIMKLSEHFSLD